MPEMSEEKIYNNNISMEDHNAIVTLVASTSAFHATVNEKFAEIKADIKEIKEGTSAKINEHEIRINALELSKTRQNVTMGIGVALLSGLISLLVWHILK